MVSVCIILEYSRKANTVYLVNSCSNIRYKNSITSFQLFFSCLYFNNSVLLTFVSVLLTFVSVLLTFVSVLLTFASVLLTFVSVLLTFVTVLLTFVSVLLTFVWEESPLLHPDAHPATCPPLPHWGWGAQRLSSLAVNSPRPPPCLGS
jgi:hypothetical protein